MTATTYLSGVLLAASAGMAAADLVLHAGRQRAGVLKLAYVVLVAAYLAGVHRGLP